MQVRIVHLRIEKIDNQLLLAHVRGISNRSADERVTDTASSAARRAGGIGADFTPPAGRSSFVRRPSTRVPLLWLLMLLRWGWQRLGLTFRASEAEVWLVVLLLLLVVRWLSEGQTRIGRLLLLLLLLLLRLGHLSAKICRRHSGMLRRRCEGRLLLCQLLHFGGRSETDEHQLAVRPWRHQRHQRLVVRHR